MVVVVWWSGAALQLRDLDDLPLLMEPWIAQSIRKSWRRMSCHQSVTSSSRALGYAAGQWSQTHHQVHLLMAQEKQNEGFWVAESKSRLKSDWDTVAWPYTVLSCLKKTLQCGRIKTILQRWAGQNSSTAMLKKDSYRKRLIDCSCCQVIRFRGTFSGRARQVWTAFFP